MATHCTKCGGLVYDDGSLCIPSPKHFCCCPIDIRYSNPHYGWTCPRCFKVHSPYSIGCDCMVNSMTSAGFSVNLTVPNTAYKIEDFKPGEFGPSKGRTDGK